MDCWVLVEISYCPCLSSYPSTDFEEKVCAGGLNISMCERGCGEGACNVRKRRNSLKLVPPLCSFNLQVYPVVSVQNHGRWRERAYVNVEI